MISYLGDFKEDATVYIMFNTFSSDDPSASCTITNFINTDVHIHKDDGLTQRNNAAGITVSVDFDGITGSHMVKIDTSDDTVGGFWVSGSDYFVRIEGTTIDGATINSVIGQFSIDNRIGVTVADIIAGIADGPYDLQEMMRLIFAATCNKVSGGGTATIVYRDSADGKDRITTTVDTNGNRTAVTLDGS